ncbi:MAG: hypothetical protein R3E18_12440 [Sphingomonadaceae bacterium]|nr:hypothetical protein [Sphingomonadaceae bacterium]
MTRFPFSAITGAALLASTMAANASPGGRLGTLPNGSYACSLPGSADGPAVHPAPDMDFTITNSSSYVMAGKRGIYLLLGKEVRFTSGPMKGMRFRQTGSNTVQLIGDDGELAPLRCTRRPG